MVLQLIAPTMLKYAITTETLNDKVLDNLKQSGYNITNDRDIFSVIINDEKYTFRIYDNGILVFNYCMELHDDIQYTDILLQKEKKTNEIIDRGGAVVIFLKTLEECVLTVFSNIEESLFFNGKYISYCLATYKITQNHTDIAYSLALKRSIKEEQIESLNEPSLKTVIINENNRILLIWGARVFICNDGFGTNLYDDYIKYESEAQYLWFIITSLDKRIDSYMLNETGRAADISSLLDTSYNVLYRKSKFDGVVSSKGHRYEIEILNNIIAASKINDLYENLEKKIRLLKEKSSLVEEQIDKINRKYVNILLGVISILSAISTVYSFVSVFKEGDKKIIYIAVTLAAIVLFFGANILQRLGKRKLRGKKKRP